MRTLSRPVRVLAGLVAFATLASVPVTASAVPAGDVADGPYERVQATVSWTVYAPTVTYGLPRSGFQRIPCPGTEAGISVDYGSQATRSSRWIGLNEYDGRPCLDGPDGVTRYTTFWVRGAKAVVNGDCANDRPTCASTTAALVEQGAYTTVTLPGSRGRSATFVEVYTQNLTLADIKRFVRGLVPVR